MVQGVKLPLFWGENDMTTIRSHFSYEQFEQAFQRFAHEIAIKKVKNLQDAVIEIRDGKIGLVKTAEREIRFRSSRISYYEYGKPVKRFAGFYVCPKCGMWSDNKGKCSYCGAEMEEYWETVYPESFGFEIEEKLYLDSNHQTKITLLVDDEKAIKKTKKFIDKLMANQKPLPRFSLSNMK